MGTLGLIGFILPAVIDLINRKIADSDIRFWVSMMFCIVTGTIVYFVTTGGTFTGIDDLADQILIIIGQAQLSYQALWSDSNLRAKLHLNAKIEQE